MVKMRGWAREMFVIVSKVKPVTDSEIYGDNGAIVNVRSAKRMIEMLRSKGYTVCEPLDLDYPVYAIECKNNPESGMNVEFLEDNTVCLSYFYPG